MNHPTPFWTAFGELFFLALQSGNVGGVWLHPALALDLVAIAEIGKGSQAQIDTDRLISWFKLGSFTFTEEASVPVSDRIALNGQGLDGGTNGAMQLDRNVSNLGKRASVAYQLEAGLLEGERIVQPFALEAWVSWFSGTLVSWKRQEAKLVGTLETTSSTQR